MIEPDLVRVEVAPDSWRVAGLGREEVWGELCRLEGAGSNEMKEWAVEQ